jgi:allantoicase
MIDSAQDKALSRFVNLASPRLGASVTQASDEFFAAKDRLIQDGEPIFYPGRFDENGKWMDGWETRRRRGLGHDWCLIKLGVPGVLDSIEIDTRHFTGNFPPGASIEGCVETGTPGPNSVWLELVPSSPLKGNDRQLFLIDEKAPIAWLRLSIFPDGGIARLRAYGTPFFNPASAPAGSELELSSLRYGGRILGYSDAHYGAPWVILTDGRGATMGDGWETRRRREPGNDWMVIALGVPGLASRIEVDTAHFKGNYPEKVSVTACDMGTMPDDAVICQSMFWLDLLPPRKVGAHLVHSFGPELLAPIGRITHVRLNLHPDGGISRFRVFGRPA